MIAREPNPTKPEGEGWTLYHNYYREGVTCLCGHAYYSQFKPNVCYSCGRSLNGVKSEAVLVNHWIRKKHWWSLTEECMTAGPNKAF